MAHVCHSCGAKNTNALGGCRCGAADPFVRPQGVSGLRLPVPPVLMPDPGRGRPRWLVPGLAILGTLAVLTTVLAVAVVLKGRGGKGGSPSGAPVATTPAVVPVPSPSQAAPALSPSASAPDPAPVVVPRVVSPPPPVPNLSPPVPSAVPVEPKPVRRRRRLRPEPRREPRRTPPPRVERTVRKAPTPPRKAPMSVDEMLERLSQRKRRDAAAAQQALPPRPTRTQVRRGVYRVLGAAKRCVARYGQRGLVNVKVTVAGATGRVTRAAVTGRLSGTPAAACVERAFRTVRFTRFRQTTHSFTAPLVLR